MSTAANPGAQLIAPRHPIDAARLSTYLRANVEDFAGELVIEQYQGGQSNPTYRLTAGAKQYVLRRKPPGCALRPIHAMWPG